MNNIRIKKNMLKTVIILMVFDIICVFLLFTTSFASNNQEIETSAYELYPVQNNNVSEGEIVIYEENNEVPDKTEIVNTGLGDVKFEFYNINADPSDKMKVKIYTTGSNITNLEFNLEYDKNIFKEIDFNNDTSAVNGWRIIELKTANINATVINCYPDDDNYAISNGLIAEIDFTVLQSFSNSKISIKDLWLSDDHFNDSLIYDTSIKDWIGAEKDIIVSQTPKVDDLYLTSDIYKIGNREITKYENGDIYISRVNNEITKLDFMSKLQTNGSIRVLKQDGTELENTKYVGTGMTLEVTKDDQEIRLMIVVMGDLSGEGRVTAQDLSEINRGFLEDSLINEWFIASDFDENNKITASDLSEEIKLLLQ